jgi:hypothetical protein
VTTIIANLGASMRLTIFIAILFVFTGCSSKKVRLNKQGSRVKLANRLPPSGVCRELGEVYGMGKAKADDLTQIVKSARNDLRNNAARKGANYINLETNNTVQFSGQAEVVLGGMSFRCGGNKNRMTSKSKRASK